MKKTQQKIFSIFLILALICGLSCDWVKKKPVDPAEMPSMREVAAAEARLTEAALQMLAISPEVMPKTYAYRKKRFEAALDAYMQLTGFQTAIDLKIKRDGKTFILPLKTIEVSHLATEKYPQDTVRTMGEEIGPDLQGELVDIAWEAGQTAWPRRFYLLFQDSLATNWWPQDQTPTMKVYPFPEKWLNVHFPAYATGIIHFPENNQPGTTLEIQTSRLKGWFLAGKNLSDLMPLDISLADSLSFKRHFPLVKNAEREGYSLREASDGDRQIWADSLGYIHIYRAETSDTVWRSPYPFGERLFLLDENQVAVCHPYSRFFSVYKWLGDSLLYQGKSPLFEGRINGVLHTAKPDGYLVAIGLHNTGGIPKTRLKFLRKDDFRWNASSPPDTLQQPDFSQTFTFMQSNRAKFSLESYYTIPPTARYNLFETLFRISPDGDPAPLLAKAIRADSSFRQWTIRLRNNVRFSDGSLMTAADVLQSWQINFRADLKYAPETQWNWEIIQGAADFSDRRSDVVSGIKILDEQTLQIKLSEPRPAFVRQLTQPAFRVVKRLGKDAFGTGSFYIENIRNTRQGYRVRCLRNPYYHLGVSPLKQIDFIYSEKNNTANLSQKTQGVLAESVEDELFFRQLPQFKMHSPPAEKKYFLVFNPEAPALTDSHLRKFIVTEGLQKDALADNITEGICAPINRFFYDEIEEKPAIYSTNHRLSQPLNIAFRVDDPVSQQIAERLSARLSQINIPTLPPQGIRATDWHAMIQNGRYDLIIDCYTTRYRFPLYDFAQLLENGYLLPEDTREKLKKELTALSGNGAAIEQELVASVILYPLFAAKSYIVLPKALRGIFLEGHNTAGFSRAWLPVE